MAIPFQDILKGYIDIINDDQHLFQSWHRDIIFDDNHKLYEVIEFVHYSIKINTIIIRIILNIIRNLLFFTVIVESSIDLTH